MVLAKNLKACAFFIMVQLMFCLPCWSQAVAEAAQSEADAVIVKVGEREIEHRWTSNPQKIFGPGDVKRWRWFMHGATDGNSRPFDWESYLTPQQERYLSGKRIRNEVKRSELFSLELPGKASVTTARPVVSLSELGLHAGQAVRLYIWIQGEDTGQGGSLWDCAPKVRLSVRNSTGVELAGQESLFRTRGTFPWFCYHVDMMIPKSVIQAGEDGVLGGLFVQVSNPTSGKAWFCTPSVEYVAGNGLSLSAELADPRRGTFAPNPDYDELPMNFLFGLPQGEGITWKFLDGNLQTRSIVQSYDLEAYLKRYQNDWFHVLQAYPYLLYCYNVGMKYKMSSELQPGWDGRLMGFISQMQDERTGLWQLNGRGNLLLTQLMVSNCYAPERQHRTGETVFKSEWCAYKGQSVPRVEALMKSVLAAQMKDKDGVLGGWNKYAFQGEDLIEASRDVHMFDMRYSAAAVTLLSNGLPLVSASLQNQIRKALQGAYTYAVQNVMNTTWLWCEDETQEELFFSPYGFQFLEGTQALDAKMGLSAMSAPNVRMTVTKENRCELKLTGVPEQAVSMRLYEIQPGKRLKDCTDLDLAAIVTIAPRKPATTDPLILADKFCTAQTKPGIRKTMTARDAGAFYVDAKTTRLNKGIRVTAMDKKSGQASFGLPARLKGAQIGMVYADVYGNLTMGQEFTIPR